MSVPIAAALVMEQLPKTGVAEVPFAFQVEKQTFPPGTYSFQQADLGRSICIENTKFTGEGATCVAAKHRFGRAQRATLAFAQRHGHYFLSEIWFEADGRASLVGENPEESGALTQYREARYVHFR